MAIEWLTGAGPPSKASHRFLEQLLAGPEALTQIRRQWFDQDEILQRRLATAYFLADPHPDFDVLYFLTVKVPALLRSLHRVTIQERETLQGRIRGRTDWSATYKARSQAEHSPLLFVCRRPERIVNTPENQFLKFVLTKIQSLAGEVPPNLCAAEYWAPQMPGVPGVLAQRLDRIQEQSFILQNHGRLRTVETPEQITSHHIQRVQLSKKEEYVQVYQIYARYRQVIFNHQWPYLQAIMRRTLLLPLQEDEIPYIAIAAAAWI